MKVLSDRWTCVHDCRDFDPEEELEKRRQSLVPILEAGVAEASAPRAEVGGFSLLRADCRRCCYPVKTAC